MLNEHILTITILTPVLGAILIALLPRQGRAVPWSALVVSLLLFAETLHLPSHYDYGTRWFQFVENYFWIQNPNIHYHVGVDGISLWLIVLTGFLAPLGVLVSWNAITTRTKEFYFLFLLQQTAMLGVFASLDLFLYYGFWELSLVPMAILIAMFGRTRGPAAAIKFFLYTFIPSALFLVGILYLYAKTGTFDFVELQAMLGSGHLAIASTALSWVAFSFLFAFAVKVPVFPLHAWIGDVYSEAPTAMAMVVAGKLGLYSLIRFNLGLFPAQSREFAPWMIALSVIGILYGSLNALVQKDLKRVVAFGTVAAVSFCTLGIFCFSIAGLDGALYQTINEGLIGGSLLCLLGLLHERYGTYETAAYGGLAARMPWMVAFFVITGLALVGLPILNGFVGEFLVLSTAFATHLGWGVAATVGVILSAAYFLTMTQKVFYGAQSPLVQGRAGIRDLSGREHALIWPFIVLMLVMGVASPYWFRAIEPAITGYTTHGPSDITAPQHTISPAIAGQTIPARHAEAQ